MLRLKGEIKAGTPAAANQEDRDAIVMLRKKIRVNDDQYHLGYITKEEYEQVLAEINSALTALEEKYGLREFIEQE